MAEANQNQVSSPSPTIPPALTAPLTPAAPAVKTSAPGAPGKPPTASPAEAAPKTDERVSSKLQTLINREKQAIERERVAKTKESEVEAKTKALTDREARLQEFETLKETNPLKALELLGLSYQQLTQIALSDGQVTPEMLVKKVDDKVTAFISQQEKDRVKAAEDAKAAAEAQEAQVTEDFQREIGSFIDQNAKKYELIQFEGQQSLVFAVINEHYHRTMDPKTGLGKILSISEAADKVEIFLEKKYNEALALEKFKSKVVPAQTKPPVKQPNTPSQKPTTLSNSMAATPAKPATHILTDEERIQKAINFARGLRP